MLFVYTVHTIQNGNEDMKKMKCKEIKRKMMLSKGIIICALLYHRNGIHNSHGQRSLGWLPLFQPWPTHICHYIVEFVKKRFAHKGTLLAASNAVITIQKQNTNLNVESIRMVFVIQQPYGQHRQHNTPISSAEKSNRSANML